MEVLLLPALYRGSSGKKWLSSLLWIHIVYHVRSLFGFLVNTTYVASIPCLHGRNHTYPILPLLIFADYESFKGAINEDVISIVRFVDPTFTTNYSAQVHDIKNGKNSCVSLNALPYLWTLSLLHYLPYSSPFCVVNLTQSSYSNKYHSANRAIIVVFALVPDMERILDAANAHKLLGSPYVWIGPSLLINFNHTLYPFHSIVVHFILSIYLFSFYLSLIEG